MNLTYYDYSKDPWLAADIETKDPLLTEKGPGVYRKDGYILGVSFSDGELSEYYPLNSEENERYIKAQLEASNRKVFANVLYDADWLVNYQGMKINGSLEDVQVAEPLLNEYANSYSLDNLAKQYLKDHKESSSIKDYVEQQGWKGNPMGYLDRIPLEIVAKYAAKDAELTYKIFALQLPLLMEQNLMDVYRLEMDLIPLLLLMRKTGVRLNEEKVPQLGLKLVDLKHDSQQELNRLFKGELNINSSVQLKKLFEQEGIPITYKEPTDLMLNQGKTRGNPTFSKDVLNLLNHPLVDKILNVRHIITLLSLFIHPYPDLLVDGRLHCSFHPLRSDDYGTVSGRYSSSKPNLQQVSGKDEEDYLDTTDPDMKGLIVRKLFIPEENCDWLKLDWSQIEYRLIAHYAMGEGAEKIRRRYNEDPSTDYHKEIQEMTGLPDRKVAKNFNFGTSYGMGINLMSLKYNWNLQEAEQMAKMYHKRVPFVRETSRKVANKAKQVGFIRTIYNRRARMPASNKAYIMFNRLIQGSAADIMKKSMLDSYDAGIFNTLSPHLTVHDEMDCSMPRTKEGQEAGRELIQIMENCMTLRVPIKVDAEIGDNWGELRDWGE